VTKLQFAPVWFGRETCDAGDLVRHRHDHGYITLVLCGNYIEAGDAGRFSVREGDVLIHRPFEAHRDLFGRGAPRVLNLPLPDRRPAAAIVRVPDPDAVARLAETDLDAAAALVGGTATPADTDEDWPDRLAAELRKPDSVRIGDWARSNGLAPATVSRGFAQVFGTSAARYRAEARTRLAWEAVRSTDRPFVHLALDLGFSDQAHMTRSLGQLTGLPPGRWRRQRQFGSRRA
jgi:AraC-like DNA-binding protein